MEHFVVNDDDDDDDAGASSTSVDVDVFHAVQIYRAPTEPNAEIFIALRRVLSHDCWSECMFGVCSIGVMLYEGGSCVLHVWCNAGLGGDA